MKRLLFITCAFLVSCNSVEDKIDKLVEKIEDKETPTPTYTPTRIPPTATPENTATPTLRPEPAPGKPTIIPTIAVTAGTPRSGTTPLPTASANPVAPGVENFKDGNYGNLWKPVSDTTGNLVVVFHNKYRKEFSEGCFIEKKDGTQEELFCNDIFKCFGNPDRLTMRSTIKCSEAKEVKVVCYEANQTVTFTVDKELRGQVCRRHD